MPTYRPILFNGAMVRAILSGAKTQTRRPVVTTDIGFIGGKGEEADISKWGFGDQDGCWHVLDQTKPAWCGSGIPHESYRITCPLGSVGDRLWVRETYALIWPSDAPPENVRDCIVEYRASTDAKNPGQWPDDSKDCERPRWKPSIHMPRWASRLTLEITSVRVERLQAIPHDPWVWVLNFKVMK